MGIDLENVSDEVKKLNPGVFGQKQKQRKHKMNARSTVVDGHKFPSLGEANRYVELKMLQEAGKISGLMLQPVFILQKGFRYGGKAIRPIKYIADFQYREGDYIIVEDFKGWETPVYKIKHKMFLKNLVDGKYGEKIRYRVTRR